MKTSNDITKIQHILNKNYKESLRLAFGIGEDYKEKLEVEDYLKFKIAKSKTN